MQTLKSEKKRHNSTKTNLIIQLKLSCVVESSYKKLDLADFTPIFTFLITVI